MSNSTLKDLLFYKLVELRGKTLQVYLYLLKKEKVGVREVQKALKLKSPSLAEYHLKKLEEMGLAQEEMGKYILVKGIKPEIVKDIIKLGSILIPRFFMFAGFYLTISLYFLLIALSSSINLSLLIIDLLLLSAGIIFLIEGIRTYRRFYYTD